MGGMGMKRLVLLLILLGVLAACAAASAEEPVIEITDISGLQSIGDHPGAHFRLMNDIDLQGVDWIPVLLDGEFDGNGYGIYNMTVTQVGKDTRLTMDGNKKEYETTFAGLFSVVEKGSSVHDLKIIGAHVTIEGKTHCFASVMAGYAMHCHIDNVTVDGRVRLDNEAVMAGVAGLVGFGSGIIHNCNSRVELIVVDHNRTSRCEQFLGGIQATGYVQIQYCTVDIDAYVSCFGYCHNGGLLGLFYTSGTKFEMGLDNRVVNHNTISGRIYFFEHNPDRRAYCKADVGETLTKMKTRRPNDAKNFTHKETKNFKTILLPENCENPVYTDTVIPPADGEWGWTEHTCTTCGYTWRDSYTAP